MKPSFLDKSHICWIKWPDFLSSTLPQEISKMPSLGGGCMAYETSWPWPGVDPWMWAGWCPVSCGGFSSIPHSASSPCSNLTSFRAWRLSLLSKPCLFWGVLWILLKFWLWFPFGTVQASVHWPTATEPPPPCCGDTYARSLARPSAPFYVTPLGTSENFWEATVWATG